MIVQRQPAGIHAQQFAVPRLHGMGDLAPVVDVPSVVPGISQNTLLMIAAVVLGGAALLWLGRKYGGDGGGDMPAPRHRRKSHSVKLTDALLWAGGAAAVAYFAAKSNSI